MLYICNIIVEDKNDYDFLCQYLKKYPTKISTSFDSINNNDNTLIVGWDTIKKRFPNQNILDKEINKNLCWILGRSEKNDKFEQDIQSFINKSVELWLPKDYILFDPLLNDETLREFILNNLDTNKYSYIYFYKDVLYLNNNNKNFILNIKSFPFIYEDYKKIITSFLNNIKCICLSYSNISNYVVLDDLKCIYTFENSMWTKYSKYIDESYFDIIKGMNTKKHIPFIMSKLCDFNFSEDEKNCMKRLCEKDNITQWLSNRLISVSNDFENKKNINIININNNKLIKVPYSNKKTLTGRISATGNYNPQGLNKKNDDRKQIISRFNGGKILQFDYVSFEAKLSLYLSGDEHFINKYNREDMHLHTSYIIFSDKKRAIENREFSKNINHKFLYGASKNTILKDLSFLNNTEQVYYNIIQFLKPILNKSYKISQQLKSYGYIINDWGSIIRPEKDYAAFNNYIQSCASEVITDKTYEMKDFLKNYKTQFLFQVHDSVIFDMHPNEKYIKNLIMQKLMYYKNMIFDLECMIGDNFKDMEKIKS